jgi:hypothetical protein
MAMYLAKEKHDSYLIYDESMKVEEGRRPTRDVNA